MAVLGFNLIQGAEKHVECSRDYSTGSPGFATGHGEGLSRASLAVSKDRTVVTLNTILNDRFSHTFKYVFLRTVRSENLLKLKGMNVFLIIDHVICIFRYLK